MVAGRVRTVATVHTVLGCERVTSRYQHRKDLAPLFALSADDLAGVVLTTDQFSALVSGWNRMSADWRKAIRTGCDQPTRGAGHEYVRNELGGKTCRRCCESIRSGT